MPTKNFWDKLFLDYEKSIKKDKNADFAYEKQVNSLSLLSLCDNSGSALDLGCGDGRFTKELEARYDSVIGIDYSVKMLAQAKKVCTKSKFVLHDLETPFPDFNSKFDLIVGKLLLMYIRDIDHVATECYKVLNHRGLLILSVTHPLKWVVESTKENIDKSYKGYLSEVEVSGKIAKDSALKAKFITRTLESYVNTFTKHGFVLNTILETGAPDAFVVKYPKYLDFQMKPYRLNMRFVKK